jgi:hypothetical protein
MSVPVAGSNLTDPHHDLKMKVQIRCGNRKLISENNHLSQWRLQGSHRWPKGKTDDWDMQWNIVLNKAVSGHHFFNHLQISQSAFSFQLTRRDSPRDLRRVIGSEVNRYNKGSAGLLG